MTDYNRLELISQVFEQFRKDACLPGDDRISESFIKAAGALMGARAKPVAWLIRWPNGNEEVFMDLKIAVQQAAMFKTKPIPLGVIAAQSKLATRAVPVQKLVISKGDRNGNYQEYSVNGHECMIRVVARMVDEDEDLPLGNRVETFLLTAPTPDAERHVANHVGDLVAALARVNSMVCGDQAPRWDSDKQVTISRGMIADICDAAMLAPAAPAAPAQPTDKENGK